MRYPFIKLLMMLSMVLLSMPPFVLADSIDLSPMRGWWWYEKPLEEPKQEEVQPAPKNEVPKEVKKPEPTKKLPSLKDYTYEELWNMHPDDFQPLLMSFMKKAVMAPTAENVHEYYIVQDIARRKALAFSNVASYIWQKYPELTVTPDNPTAVPGINAKVRAQNREIETMIHQSKDQFAMIYFYSTVCEYCAEENNILKFFQDKYGWEIKGIDINQNSDTAERFGVKGVPYVLLIYQKSEKYLPVVAGVVALTDMEENLFRGIRFLKGEINPVDFGLFDFQKGGSFDTEAPIRWESSAKR